MLWTIIEHYALGVTAIGLGVAVWVVSVLLQAQVESIPFIGPWLGRNIQHVREFAVVIAVLGLSHTLVYGIGVRNGETRIQAKWDAAEKAAVTTAVTARSDAERSVKQLPPNGLRNDPRNRDK